MGSLSAWLQEHGLERYTAVFAEHDVDLEDLRLLTEADLERLGVTLGHRRRLLRALSEPASEPARAGAASTPSVQGRGNAEPQRRQLSVMFCDLVGSTALAQKLDPEELRDLMQAYQRTCGEVIARYEGHVAQYLGDGLMVYFGWPRAHEDDAVRAIRTGLEVTKAVSLLTGLVPLSARVGIHTGVVVIAETGNGDASIPKAAVGETPNIAARLQALAEPGAVLVSERTRGLAGGLFDYADLGAHALKGVAEPMRLSAVVGARSPESTFEAMRTGAELTPLVGREEEIALLLRRWQQARDGEGQVVLLGGEPGIGKSRLIRVLRERLAAERYLALRYQCSPFHLNSALSPAIDQLERAAGFAREDDPETRLDKMQAVLVGSEEQIAEAAPLYAALLSLPTGRYPALNLSPQKQKEKVLEALVRQVEALAQQQPVLMVFEDAHWMDATSHEAMDLLVPRLRDQPVLLVVTHRPEYDTRWVDQAHVTTLGLNRLSRRQGAELVTRLTGDKPLPQQVHDQILAHTDGVPLFIEELTKSVLESGLLRERTDRYVLQAPPSGLVIPATLRDSLIARLERLAPIREVAQLGACIGREFSYELLAMLSQLQGEQLDAALEQLTKTGLVYRRGTPPSATYTFKHALVQDAAYESVLKRTRYQVHGKIARALEEHFPAVRDTRPEILAHHCTAAGLTHQAIAYWRKAGELALRRVALREAIAHLNEGLQLTATLAACPERDAEELALRTVVGTAWVGLRGWAAPEVETTFTAALALARSLEHRSSYLPVLHGLYSHHLNRGHVAGSLRWVREVQDAAETLADAELRITGHRLAQNSHFYLGHLEEAQRHGDRIAALYDPDQGRRIETLTNIDPLTASGVWSALSLWILGYPDQALRRHGATEAHARERARPFGICWALTIGSGVFGCRGEADEALVRVDEAERLARTHGIPIFSDVFAPVFKGMACVQSGQTAQGIALLRDALGKWSALGGHVATPYWKAVLAEALACSHDIEGALALIAECIAQINRPGWEERWALAEVLRLKGWMLHQQGRLAEARESLLAAIETAREQQARSWELRASTTLARLLSDYGERNAARNVLAPVYAKFTEGFGTRDLTQARALLGELT